MEIKSFIKEKLDEEIIEINQLNTSGNLTYKITTSKNNYILRLCGTGMRHRTKEEIDAEVELLNFLQERGIPVPKIKFTASFEDKNGLCYEFLNGNTIKESTPEQCYQVGEMLGKIHNLTENYPYARKSWDIKNTVSKFEEVENLFQEDEHLQKNNFAERIKLILYNLKFENLPEGAIHEDLGMRHILFENNVISGILDWDRSYSGKLILDLGQAIRGWCLDNWEKLNSNKFNSLINGYESKRKLSLSEKQYLTEGIKFAFIERAIAFAVFALNENKEEYKNYAISEVILAESIINML